MLRREEPRLMQKSSVKRNQQKTDLREKERDVTRSLFERIPEALLILNPKGVFLKVNQRAAEMLGYSNEELQQRVLFDLVIPEERDIVQKAFEEIESGGEIRLNASFFDASKRRIAVELAGASGGEVFFVTLRGLREKAQIEEELEKTKKSLTEKIRERDQYARERQALNDIYREKLKEIEKLKAEKESLSYTDDLTEISNHRYFIHQLTEEVKKQKRYPTALSLLMIDIDYFKHYNDTNGHLAGDQVLRAVALLIGHGVRDSDIVARYGGEEFSAILINTGKKEAMEIAERVRRVVAEASFPNEHAQPNGKLTVSIGAATFSPSICTLTDLIREADNALYRAKRAGRNRVEG
jgi:diguanylate cyclase (GGDEF)-like protein/PAS domain S-box-containing protein